MDAIGHPGMRGRNVQNLVVVDTGIDQDQFGAMILQNVKASNHVLPVIWVMSMIMLAMQFAITVHIQVECVVVQQDGMDDVAAIVCMKSSFCRYFVLQINTFYCIKKVIYIYFRNRLREPRRNQSWLCRWVILCVR